MGKKKSGVPKDLTRQNKEFSMKQKNILKKIKNKNQRESWLSNPRFFEMLTNFL